LLLAFFANKLRNRGISRVIAMKNFKLPSWAEALKDPEAHNREQKALGQIWTLLGIVQDLPKDGDWFRTTLGGRSVFVQRFGDDIRAFENVCVHRFYPLRTEDRGNGVIRCGFHHWQYNKDGLAVGIPKCKEYFGVTPRELNARLRPVEVSICGMLIFGRFSGPEAVESLKQYLRDGYDILERLCPATVRKPYQHRKVINANWKLNFHITLDDYHIVAVHRDTFGKEGYLQNEVVKYYRFGWHSAYFYETDPAALQDMAEACREDNYQTDGYRIFQFFPNLLVVHLEAAYNTYMLVQNYTPIAHNQNLLRTWIFPCPLPHRKRADRHQFLATLARPFLPIAVPIYAKKITGEDNDICEQIQKYAGQIGHWPILGSHEERITWFEETYNQALGRPPLTVEMDYPIAVPTAVSQTP
jgi:phenylpropionate dioxygenase-like ring-hydroxylating dioxygenase large terminal subunit